MGKGGGPETIANGFGEKAKQMEARKSTRDTRLGSGDGGGSAPGIAAGAAKRANLCLPVETT